MRRGTRTIGTKSAGELISSSITVSRLAAHRCHFRGRDPSYGRKWPRRVKEQRERGKISRASIKLTASREGGNHDAGVTKSMLHRLLSPSLSYFFRFNREARFPSRDNFGLKEEYFGSVQRNIRN